MPDIDIPLSAIAAKTDQINADDLKFGPIIAKITRVTESDGQADRDKQPHQIYLEGQRLPWRPCLTMRRLLVEMWGREAVNKNWAGHTIKLIRDPDVHFGGEKTGGIRLVAADINRPFSCLLPVSRGKRKTFVVEPLPRQESRAADSKPPPVLTPVQEIIKARGPLVTPPLTRDEKMALVGYYGDGDDDTVKHLTDLSDADLVAEFSLRCGRTQEPA